MDIERKSANDLHRMEKDAAERIAADPDSLDSYLRAVSCLYPHGSMNHLIAWAQRPDATEIAGIRNWKERGRPVRKNEKPLWILLPLFRYDTGSAIPLYSEDQRIRTDDQKRILYAREPTFFVDEEPIPVYDISQTEGEQQKERSNPYRLEAAIERCGYQIVPVERKDLPMTGRDGCVQGADFLVAVDIRGDERRYFTELIHMFTNVSIPAMIRRDRTFDDRHISLLSRLVQRCLLFRYLPDEQKDPSKVLAGAFTGLPAEERRQLLIQVSRCYRKILHFVKGEELSFTGTAILNGLLDSGLKSEVRQVLSEAERSLPENSEAGIEMADLADQIEALENGFLEKLYLMKLNNRVIYASPPMKLPIGMEHRRDKGEDYG